jgi:hypothetical protein
VRFVRDVQVITLDATGGPNDQQNVVMAPQDRPFRELTIWGKPGTGRVVGDAAGVRNFTSEVFFGPSSQAAAAARADDEIYLVYDPGDTVRIWPANNTASNPESAGTRRGVLGFPVTVQLTNLAATKVVITIIFLAMTIDQG